MQGENINSWQQFFEFSHAVLGGKCLWFCFSIIFEKVDMVYGENFLSYVHTTTVHDEL